MVQDSTQNSLLKSLLEFGSPTKLDRFNNIGYNEESVHISIYEQTPISRELDGKWRT